jgi:type II secretion system (T2SS) protein M
MKGRDRIIAMVAAVLVVVVGGWMLLVSPERKKATELDTKVASAQSEVSTAQGEVTSAQAAKAKYSSAYASVVQLGKAVPASQEVSSLIYQLEGATSDKHVQFNSIVNGAGASATSATSATPAAAVSAGFTQMPFTFIFEGGFFDLEHLFGQLTSFTNYTPGGQLNVRGRLLTVQSVKLAPSGTSTGKPSSSTKQTLTGTITASAYVLPAGSGLTAGATPTGPTAAAGATPATSTPTSTTAPAVARVTP